MPVLDASALTTDPEGLAFLAGVLGTEAEAAKPGRRFPVQAWAPKAPAPGSIDAALAPASAPPLDPIDRFAEAAL